MEQKKIIYLGWDESQKHYCALHDIEEKHLPIYLEDKLSNSQKKKLEVKIFNEQREYLETKGIVKTSLGFYKLLED